MEWISDLYISLFVWAFITQIYVGTINQDTIMGVVSLNFQTISFDGYSDKFDHLFDVLHFILDVGRFRRDMAWTNSAVRTFASSC